MASSEIESVGDAGGDHEGDHHYHFELLPEHVEGLHRLDQVLAKHTKYSRNFIKNLFEAGGLTPAENSPYQGKIELKKLPPLGTIVEMAIPAPIPSEAAPENLPLEILYEDEHLVVINKQAGMVTHPAPGNYTGTLVNAVLYHCKMFGTEGIGGVLRPGIVHRLDKGTSGVMVVAKSAQAHEGLILLFSQHNIHRKYWALVYHPPVKPEGTVETFLGRHPTHRQKMSTTMAQKHGRRAVTHYKLLAKAANSSFGLMECRLETGRTHQIRVHMTEILKAPLLCDSTYHSGDRLKLRDYEVIPPKIRDILVDYPHPLLHAKELGFRHPITGAEMLFTSPPPKPFEDVLALEFGAGTWQ